MSRFASYAGLLAGAAAVSAAAQVAQTEGTVRGQVTDSAGAALPGARITVRGTGAEATTDRQGQFVLQGLSGSAVTLEVSYIGLPTHSETVSVAPSGSTTVAIVVPRENGQIVVTGALLSGTARALNRQRQADNLTNVVSSDDIGRACPALSLPAVSASPRANSARPRRPMVSSWWRATSARPSPAGCSWRRTAITPPARRTSSWSPGRRSAKRWGFEGPNLTQTVPEAGGRRPPARLASCRPASLAAI